MTWRLWLRVALPRLPRARTRPRPRNNKLERRTERPEALSPKPPAQAGGFYFDFRLLISDFRFKPQFAHASRFQVAPASCRLSGGRPALRALKLPSSRS